MKYILALLSFLLLFSGCDNNKEKALTKIQSTINNIEKTKECILNGHSTRDLTKCNKILDLNKENKIERNIKLPESTSMLQYKIFKMLDKEESDLKDSYICINESKTKKDLLECRKHSNILEIK